VTHAAELTLESVGEVLLEHDGPIVRLRMNRPESLSPAPAIGLPSFPSKGFSEAAT
jgi:hypothetical protein